MPEKVEGFAAVLDREGKVGRILLDSPVFLAALREGAHLRELVDPSSAEKAELFLECIADRGSALLWEMHVFRAGRIEPVLFCGAAGEDEIMVACATSAAGFLDMYEHFLSEKSEHTRPAAEFLKREVLSSNLSGAAGETLYDEITRLNNELVNAQREMAKKNSELETLNTQKNILLGMAAHDMRNPLGAIRNFADFLLDDHGKAIDSTCEEILNIVRDTSNSMLNMVEDLLDVSVLESGKLKLRPSPVDLVQLVGRRVKLHSHPAESKKIQVEFTVEGEIPLIMADGPKLSQVADNLVSNAVKYSLPGTTVRVKLVRNNGDVSLYVRDQGQGIREDELHRLFKPFAKISSKPTGNETSTGLGLAIVSRIVEAHGGEIRVESELGKGSLFEVHLPLNYVESEPDDA
jgi:signal transduction histidine kinase